MSEILDKRLGRLPEFDPRSRSFRITDVLPERKPRSYTWSLPISPLNQLQTSACVGFAFAHELAARPVRVQGIDYEYAQGIYRRAQELDEWEGSNYDGTSVLAGAKAVKESGKIKEYRWAFGLDEAILTIGYSPVVIGINWYTGMMETDSDGFIHVTGSIAGGHAIFTNGISLKGKYVKLLNSWGQEWGQDGTCKLSFDDFGRLLSEQGECVVPVGRIF